MTPVNFWPSFLGIVVLFIGLFVARRDFSSRRVLDKLTALAGVFFAAPLAVFSGEHLSDAHSLMQVVPVWMPARLFWAYFVGLALISAALSLALHKYVRWSSLLLAIMFAIFVALLHAPNVVIHLKNRIFWVVAFRDFTFAAGALSLFATQLDGRFSSSSTRMIFAARVCIGAILIFFGVQHLLHPEFAPGVPLSKITPPWVPLRFVLAYVVGASLAIAGLCLILKRFARAAATFVGWVMTLLTLLLYTPILAMARGTGPIIVGINYVADTLLFGGAILLLANALSTDAGTPEPAEETIKGHEAEAINASRRH